MTTNRLDELAADIRGRLATIDGPTALENALIVGADLIEAKGLVARGEWRNWLQANFDKHFDRARVYMKLSANENDVRARHCQSVREAERALRPKRAAPKDEKTKTLRSKEGARMKRLRGEDRRKAERAGRLARANMLRLQERLADVVRVLETTDFEIDFELDEITEQAAVQVGDDLAVAIDWCERALTTVTQRLGRVQVLAMIRKLEATDGRTPEEAEAFLRRAAIMRRKYKLELVA